MVDRSRASRRRRLLLGIGAAVVAPPGIAQPRKRPARVGIAFHSNPESVRPYLDAFVQGMSELGQRLDRDYAVEARYAQGRNERYPAVMRELLDAGVEVIVVGPNTGVQAAKEATSAVPIVMVGATDPESTGLVASVARPGGNITGLASNSVGLNGKRLELVREILPGASRVAYLADPKVPAHARFVSGVEDAARALSFKLVTVEASSAEELDRTLASLAAQRPDAMVVGAAIVLYTHRRRIVDFCAQHRVPAVYAYREPVLDGGLASYAPSVKETFRKSATYVARILGGAKPADLPVEQPTRIELVVNLKTAQSIGIAIPNSLLARADEVIR
jgi:putative ABC transport system substrate-binding protein